MNKYFIEYLGVLVLVTAKLLTNAEPWVMALVYFSMLHLTRDISTGYFTLFAPIANYLLGRESGEDVMKNVIAQILGALSAILLFKPIKHIIE